MSAFLDQVAHTPQDSASLLPSVCVSRQLETITRVGACLSPPVQNKEPVLRYVDACFVMIPRCAFRKIVITLCLICTTSIRSSNCAYQASALCTPKVKRLSPINSASFFVQVMRRGGGSKIVYMGNNVRLPFLPIRWIASLRHFFSAASPHPFKKGHKVVLALHTTLAPPHAHAVRDAFL